MVAAIMMTTASYAWFSMGTTASATGMQVSATASSSLIITDDVSKLTSAKQSVTLPTATRDLVPAMHDDASATKLSVPADTSLVDAGTGKYTGTYVDADTTAYYDYTVLLATTGGAALTGKNLTATVSIPAELTNYIHNAVSIDFWMGTTTNGTTVAPTYTSQKVSFNEIVSGTTVSAGRKEAKLTLATGVDIPLLLDSDTDDTLSYITVTMRVYFDGSMEEGSTGNTYVRNTKASTAGASFNVTFAAE
jgi:hypothetical protein